MEKPPEFPRQGKSTASAVQQSNLSRGSSMELGSSASSQVGGHTRQHSHPTKRQPAGSSVADLDLALPPPQHLEETLITFQWIEAIRSSNLTDLSMLISKYSAISHSFGTPLHLAAAFASRSVFDQLLRQLVDSGKIDINSADAKGNTALHLASKAGRLSICESLLKCGADCTLSNNDGRDASEMAKTQSVLDLVLFHRKLFVTAKAKDMLHLATSGNMAGVQAMFNDTRVAKLVDINYQDPMTGDSLLHIASEQNNVDMVTWCLKMRADPLVRDKRGKLPMEKTKNDRIKVLLKGVINQGSFSGHQPASSAGVKMQGVLYKWTNYAGGYKKRWFLLEDGILYYYRSQEDAPVSCRGSMSLQVAKLWIDSSDKNRFDVIGKGNVRYHLRAEHPMEAKRWVIALTEAKQWLQDHDEFKNRVEKNASSTIIAVGQDSDTDREGDSESSADFRWNTYESTNTLLESGNAVEEVSGSISYEENFHATINAALAGVQSQQQLMISCLSLLQANSNYSQLKDTFRQSSQSLLGTLNDLLRMNNERERFWEKRLEREEAIKTVWEENLRSLAADHDNLQRNAALEVKTLENRARSASAADMSEEDEEFFDVQSDASPISIALIPKKLIESSLRGYPSKQPDGLRVSLPLVNSDRVEVSLWSVLKNNIGKDLSKLALPVYFNEPMSMLQRLCEDMEYSSLLDMAASSSDSMERIQLVAAFAMSNYNSTFGRTGKPFNPLLGETFEYVRKDGGYRYISEQVSHHPPISACYCESDNYQFWAEANLKNRFTLKNLEVSPLGGCHVVLKSTGEHYSWRKVTTAVNNLIVGKLWIDHFGDMLITNHLTNETCLLTFKQAGWSGRGQYEIVGEAKDAKGNVKFELSGDWVEKLVSKKRDDPHHFVTLWKKLPMPENSEKMFNFTHFAITLNELSDDLVKYICPTDSRLRPDQRAMEMGKFEQADDEKSRLEEKQRVSRHERHEKGIEWSPMWFRREVEKDTGDEHWLFTGGYWESRDRNWVDTNLPVIF
eukprot:Partr_v1_DN28436_c0_g1_i2_m41728 putative Oxysterol-binding protein